MWVIKSNAQSYWSEGRDLSDPHWTRNLGEATTYASKEKARQAAKFFHIINPNIQELVS